MRYLTVLAALLLLFASCKKSSSSSNGTFSFDISGGYGYCTTCVKPYVISNGTLKLKDSLFANDKYLLAKQLQDELPLYLRTHPNQTFGCPGCADGPGIHLQLTEGLNKTHWTLDTNIGALPVELRDYATKAENIVAQLR